MRLWALFVGSVLLIVVGCAASESNLSIADCEAAGFEKNQQQIFQLVGAVDGWSGTWAGDVVEIYQFDNPEKIDRETWEPMVAEGNFSGWEEFCQVRNLAMLSKGNQACRALESVAAN